MAPGCGASLSPHAPTSTARAVALTPPLPPWLPPALATHLQPLRHLIRIHKAAAVHQGPRDDHHPRVGEVGCRGQGSGPGRALPVSHRGAGRPGQQPAPARGGNPEVGCSNGQSTAAGLQGVGEVRDQPAQAGWDAQREEGRRGRTHLGWAAAAAGSRACAASSGRPPGAGGPGGGTCTMEAGRWRQGTGTGSVL